MGNYFVICVSEDGDLSIRSFTRKEILKEINDGEVNPNACRHFIDESNPMYWGENNTLIIKGEIVSPKGVKVVTEFDIE